MLLFLLVVTTPHHRWLGSEYGYGSLGFLWSYADNFGVLARGENCTNVHLARLIAGVKKAGLDVHDVAHATGSPDVLGYQVSEWDNGYHVCVQSHGRSLRAVVSAVGRWSSSMVTSLLWRSAIVVLSQSLTLA